MARKKVVLVIVEGASDDTALGVALNQVFDTDAAYIPDANIIEDTALEEVTYEDDGIHTTNVEAIKNRNKTKRDNLYRLRTQGAVWGVPYRIYYMSCNLDHVLHNKRNSTDDEKENDAYAFAKQYKRDRDGFVKFISESAFSVMADFKESWKFIEKDMNSIERYTNLCICIVEETNCGTLGEKQNETII